MLSPDLQAAYEDGFKCGKQGDCRTGDCPHTEKDAPGLHSAWMNGFMAGRMEADEA